jgi:hypothetical protein
MKDETQSNTKEVGTITQRLFLCGSGFKRSYAMVGSSGNDHVLSWLIAGIVLDASGLFFHYWFYVSCVEQVVSRAW